MTRAARMGQQGRTAVRLSGLFILLASTVHTHAADTLTSLLDSRELERASNPVPINYLLREGHGRLPPDIEAKARTQLTAALRLATSPMYAMMRGITEGMNSPTMQRMQRQASEQAKPANIAKNAAMGVLGIGGGSPSVPSQEEIGQAQREMKQGMADPWIRGIEAAEAFVALGDAQSAGRFYTSCLAMSSLSMDWLSGTCLSAIQRLGPRRAYALLDWIIKNPDQALPGAGMAAMSGQATTPETAAQSAQVRRYALEGLGRLVGTGEIDVAAREAAFSTLLSYSEGKANEPVFSGAAAGLGYAKDPRGLDPLRRLWKKAGRNEGLREAAAGGLVVGFRDGAATAELRNQLDDKDPERRFRSAALLFQIADPAAFEWAANVVTDRRAQEDTSPDIRARVTRDLIEQGGSPGRVTLKEIHRRGAGNDWLQGWVATTLLEAGDASRLAEVRAAIAKSDWTLDRPGIRAWWGRISPFIQLAAQFALTGTINVQTAAQIISQLVASERSRFAQQTSREEMLKAQLLWQATDAFAASGLDETVDDLRVLLTDRRTVVRISAARALALHRSPRAIDCYEAAMKVDFGAEGGISRAPEVRSALLRAALLRYPEDPRTIALCKIAANDPDPGVRFIALAELTARGL